MKNISDTKLNSLIDEFFPFDNLWSNQKVVIFDILRSFIGGNKFYILEAPTATGKSVISYVVAKVLNELGLAKTSTILTKTKALQAQYVKTLNMPSLWSAKSYECNAFPFFERSVYFKSPLCSVKQCPQYSNCNYVLARETFYKASLGTLNYHFFLAATHHDPDFLVCDEAHSLNMLLTEFLAVKFNTQFFNEMITYAGKHSNELDKGKIPKLKQLYKYAADNVSDNQKLVTTCNTISTHLAPIVMDMRNLANDVHTSERSEQEKKKILQSAEFLGSVLSKIQNFISSNVDWVPQNANKARGEQATLKPITAKEQAYKFFNRGEYVLLMSATICGVEEFAKELGIEKYDYKEVESTIPKENRQIYLFNLPAMNMRSKARLMPYYAGIADDLLEKYQGKRGIIHTVSYDNAEKLMELSKYKDRMMIPKPNDLLEIEDLLASADDIVLVSPSITEGIDLPNDYSRFQIFFKTPYLYLGDSWVKAKSRDQNWYRRQAALDIVQGAGRSVRSVEDFADTFVLDKNVHQVKAFFPKWFSEAMVDVQ